MVVIMVDFWATEFRVTRPASPADGFSLSLNSGNISSLSQSLQSRTLSF